MSKESFLLALYKWRWAYSSLQADS